MQVIQLLQEDIEGADHSSCNCPVARMFKRCLLARDYAVQVLPHRGFVTPKRGHPTVKVEFSDSTAHKISFYDRHRQIEPGPIEFKSSAPLAFKANTVVEEVADDTFTYASLG